MAEWKNGKDYILWSHCYFACSVTKSCLTFCSPVECSMTGFPVLHYLPEFSQTHVRWVDDAIQPSHPPSSSSPPAFNISQHQGLFQWEKFLHIRWSKYWTFSFSISPSNKYSVLISFRMDWLDLLAVQESFHHHSLKASILRHSAFFIVQLTPIHDYWKNHSFDEMDLCWQSNVSAF